MAVLSGLYLVATPIGNLSDITLRAIDTLKQVDHIAAEDTRHSARLFAHFDIQTPCFSLHDHNESARIEKILSLLANQQSVALISDAGTPLISDPGFKIVRAVREAGYAVIPVPGACAAIAGLIASGLPTDKFVFDGFLPVKSVALNGYFENLLNEKRTVIFYESVHRIEKTLLCMKHVLGSGRQIAIARELTKTFETIYMGTVEEVEKNLLSRHEVKGEFVVMVQGAPESTNSSEEIQRLLKILLKEMSLKIAVKIVCEITGCTKNTVYSLALAEQSFSD